VTEGDSRGRAGGRETFLRTVFMCFDWRVLAGFGVLDLGLLAASPQLALDHFRWNWFCCARSLPRRWCGA